MIDYEYSGNNDPCFELGNTATECEFTPELTEAWVEAYFGSADRGPAGPRAPAVLCSEYGWSLWGFIQAATRQHGLSTSAAWGMHRFEKAARPSPVGRISRLCSTDGGRWLRTADPRRVVIIGGGVIGASDGLSPGHGRAGAMWCLLEQGSLSVRDDLARSRTGRAAARHRESGTRLVQYSAELYAGLEAETGLSTGYKQCGGVIVARTPDRMVQLRRTAATAAAYDLDCETADTGAGAGAVAGRCGSTTCSGAIWLPGDGKANPTDLTLALAKGARMAACRSSSACGCSASTSSRRPAGRRVTGVRTDGGTSRPRWSSTVPASGPRRWGTRWV